MALRRQNWHYPTDSTPTYYAGNRLYPNAHGRNDYQTRTSRRIHDGLVIDRNYGLDTTSDDVNSSPYSSPYYVNGRYNSDNLVTQRGNSASIQGVKRLISIDDRVEDFTDSDIHTTIEMWQGKVIKFKMPYDGKIIGNTITLKNTGGCTGILSIYFSATEDGQPLYETAVDLCQVSEDLFEHKTLYSMTTVPHNANPRKEIYVRMEIWDEVEIERSTNPFNTGRKIEIAATGSLGRYESVFRLGDKNTPVSEPKAFSRLPNAPLIGLIYNDYESVPVNRTESTGHGATVSINGYRYDLMAYKSESSVDMIVYDKAMNKTITNQIKVDGRAEGINLVQAKDWVYYVDGYSPLQKFKVGEWISQELPRSTSDQDTNPVIAASIITKANNRIYLAGFRYDPNLVQVTEIDRAGAQFDSFPYRIYVPNQSPLETSLDPVTAIVEHESDTAMILGKTFFSIFSSNADIEDTTPQQVSSYVDSGGVQSAGDVCNYQGVIYSFDQDEGLRYFTGATWKRVPAASSVQSYNERVDMGRPRKLWGYADKLYFNYTDRVDGKYKCLVLDLAMNYQQYPVFQDIDIPFCDVRYDDDFDLVGIHPDYPCIMSLYAGDTWRRLDTPIVFERWTKHLSLPGNSADMIVKRIHNKVIANSNRWWLVGIVTDKHDLTQTRGDTVAYRIPCWDTVDIKPSSDDLFPDTDIYDEKSTAMLTISNIREQAISVQVKIRCKTFRNQCSLVSTVLEAAPKQFL